MRTSPRTPIRSHLLIALAVVAAACGGADAAGGEGESMVLTVIMADDWVSTSPIVQAARDFEEANPGVDVRLEGEVFSDIPEVVRSRMAAGQDVGVAQWHAFAAGARGWAQPITDVFDEQFDQDSYLPGAVDDVAWGGEIYGVPLDTNAMVMIANDDLLGSVGVDPARIDTLEDLAAASRTVHRELGVAGFLASASSWSTYGFVRANGGELIDAQPDGGPAFSFQAAQVVDTFTLISDLAAEGAVLAPELANFSDDAHELFAETQQTALIFSGSWTARELLDDPSVEFQWSVHPMPQRAGGGGGTVLGGSSLYIPTGSEQRELALDFMDFVTRDPVARDLWELEGRMPARVRVLDDELATEPEYAAVVDQLPSAHPMRLIAFPVAEQIYEDLLPPLLSGTEDTAGLLEEAQRVAETG